MNMLLSTDSNVLNITCQYKQDDIKSGCINVFEARATDCLHK